MTARRDLEGPVQRAVINYLRLALPGALITHTANEVAARGGDVRRAIGKAKSLGMMPGWPDLTVVWRGHIIFFEVKGPGGTLTDAQRSVADAMASHGAKWAVVRSIDEAKARLEEWAIGGGNGS